MSRPLCDAVLRVQRRRLRAAAGRSPLLLGPVALAWLAAPILALRVGSGLGTSLAPVVADVSAARALVLGLVLAVASLGAAVGVALPVRDGLGHQLAACPVSRRALALAVALPVVVGVLALVGPTLTALVVQLAAGAPGGYGAAAPLLLSLAGAAISGALLAEAALRLAGRRLAVTAVAGAATAVAMAGLEVETGTRALTGDPVAPVVAVTAIGLALCSCLWLSLLATRPERAARRRRRALLAPRRSHSAAVGAAAAALLSRPAELRLTLVVATVFGLGGLVAGSATGAPPAAGLLLGGGSCAVAGCLVPLSVRGRIDPGAWVWRVARRMHVATLWAAASLALLVLALLPSGAIAVARSAESVAIVPHVLGLALFAWACALIAGALVPRRARGAGDDALSLATFGAVAVGLGVATSPAATRLGATGIPGVVASGLVLAAVSAGAVVTLGATWGRR